MGLASSQARLLNLTTRMHQIEYNAQRIEAMKLQMANESRQVYLEYSEALEQTKVQIKTLNQDGSATFVDLRSVDDMVNMGFAIVVHDVPIEPDGEATSSAEVIYAKSDYKAVIMYKKNDTEIGVSAYEDLNEEDKAGYEKITKYENSDTNAPEDKKIIYKNTYDSLPEIVICLGDDPDDPTKKLYQNYKACTPKDMVCKSNDELKLAISKIYLDKNGGELDISSGLGGNFEKTITNLFNAGNISIVQKRPNGGDFPKPGIDDDYSDFLSSVATNTSFQEVTDETGLRKAEAKYEADMRRIDMKDRKYDYDLAALENERNAIKQEMETLKTVSKDNVDRTFKLFS